MNKIEDIGLLVPDRKFQEKIDTVSLEVKAFQKIKMEGDLLSSNESIATVHGCLSAMEYPVDFSIVSRSAFSGSPFQRYKAQQSSSTFRSLCFAWRECKIKSELQSDYFKFCEEKFDILKERYSELQYKENISALLSVALSCRGAYSEWDEQNFENIPSLLYLGRCPGTLWELSYLEIDTQLAKSKGKNDIFIQRSRLLRRVLYRPLLQRDLLESTSDLYSCSVECSAFGANFDLMYESCNSSSEREAEEGSDDEEEDWRDPETRLREIVAEDEAMLQRIDTVKAKCLEVRNQEKVRVNALLALIPMMADFSLPQAKWFTYAVLCTGDSVGRDCLNFKLPDVIVQALLCLFQEKDFLHNDDEGGNYTVRMLAASRLARCAVEQPTKYFSMVVSSFNMAFTKLSNKLPGLDGKYSTDFMNREEVAMLLDLVCEMQATGCIRNVCRMYDKTNGAIVNHSYARFSEDGTGRGVVDFLACMGAGDPTTPKQAPGNYLLGGLKSGRSVLAAPSPNNAQSAPYNDLLANGIVVGKDLGGKVMKCGSCETVKKPKEMKRCSRCASVSYCNQTCQKNHWKKHKQHCIAKNDAN